jgi:hypothetical protein
MASGEPSVPVDRLRDAVREASARTSYNVVADQIGMSRPWVKNFLGGTKPHQSTLRKLNLWYVRYQSEAGPEEMDAVTGEALVGLILTRVPEAERERARADFYGWMVRTHRSAGVGEPPWVREVREREGQGIEEDPGEEDR